MIGDLETVLPLLVRCYAKATRRRSGLRGRRTRRVSAESLGALSRVSGDAAEPVQAAALEVSRQAEGATLRGAEDGTFSRAR